MAERIELLDIDDASGLLQVAEEVHRSHRARILRHDGEELAMIVPLSESLVAGVRARETTETNWDAFRSAAGSWSDIDGEALKEYVYRARREGTRLSDHR